MDFRFHLIRRGLITADEFVDATERQAESRPTLGELALRNRKLSMQQVFAVLAAQVDSPKPFGRLAVEMGFLSDAERLSLLGKQVDLCPAFADVLVDQHVLDPDTVRRELQMYRNQVLEASMNSAQ
jgi:hypothetical protein